MAKTKEQLLNILDQFQLTEKVVSAEPFGNGHINDTLKVTNEKGEIKYVLQLPTPTPQFACFVNLPQYIKDPYRRFLENKIREEWDFSGVPIQIYFRQK